MSVEYTGDDDWSAVPRGSDLLRRQSLTEMCGSQPNLLPFFVRNSNGLFRVRKFVRKFLAYPIVLLCTAVWSAIDLTYCRLSVSLSKLLCIVAKRYILRQHCLNKWIESGPPGTRQYNFQPPTSTLTRVTPETPTSILLLYYISLTYHVNTLFMLLRIRESIDIDVMIN